MWCSRSILPPPPPSLLPPLPLPSVLCRQNNERFAAAPPCGTGPFSRRFIQRSFACQEYRRALYSAWNWHLCDVVGKRKALSIVQSGVGGRGEVISQLSEDEPEAVFYRSDFIQHFSYNCSPVFTGGNGKLRSTGFPSGKIQYCKVCRNPRILQGWQGNSIWGLFTATVYTYTLLKLIVIDIIFCLVNLV